MSDRWIELQTRLGQYTDLTPDQIDEVRDQVLVVLADEGQWPMVVEDIVEKKIDETIKEVDESLRKEIQEEIRLVIDRLAEI